MSKLWLQFRDKICCNCIETRARQLKKTCYGNGLNTNGARIKKNRFFTPTLSLFHLFHCTFGLLYPSFSHLLQTPVSSLPLSLVSSFRLSLTSFKLSPPLSIFHSSTLSLFHSPPSNSRLLSPSFTGLLSSSFKL